MDPICKALSGVVAPCKPPPRGTNPAPTKPPNQPRSYHINYPDRLPGGFQPGKKSRLF